MYLLCTCSCQQVDSRVRTGICASLSAGTRHTFWLLVMMKLASEVGQDNSALSSSYLSSKKNWCCLLLVELNSWRLYIRAMMYIFAVCFVFPCKTIYGICKVETSTQTWMASHIYCSHNKKKTRNLAIANRSRVSCACNMSRASIVTAWPWDLG